MKTIFGLLLIVFGGIAFWSNADYKNRHYLDYSTKEMNNFSKQQFTFLGLIIVGIIMILI